MDLHWLTYNNEWRWVDHIYIWSTKTNFQTEMPGIALGRHANYLVNTFLPNNNKFLSYFSFIKIRTWSEKYLLTV